MNAQEIGELIMPRLEIAAYLKDEQYAESIKHLVQDQMAGGFCIFRGKRAAMWRMSLWNCEGLQRAVAGHRFFLPAIVNLGFRCVLPKVERNFPMPWRSQKRGNQNLHSKPVKRSGVKCAR